jgi:hypothetical protein
MLAVLERFFAAQALRFFLNSAGWKIKWRRCFYRETHLKSIAIVALVAAFARAD